jgi:hypothetical protein
MKCRYDPKYVSQYKSKHTKDVKLSKKVRFPLDTQKEYLNREWPQDNCISRINTPFTTNFQYTCMFGWSVCKLIKSGMLGVDATPSVRSVVVSFHSTCSAPQHAQYGLPVCCAWGCTSS